MSPMVPFRMPLNENGLAKPSIKWRRVLLKVSGEALAGDQAQTIDPKVGKEKLPNFRVDLLLVFIPLSSIYPFCSRESNTSFCFSDHNGHCKGGCGCYSTWHRGRFSVPGFFIYISERQQNNAVFFGSGLFSFYLFFFFLVLLQKGSAFEIM